MESNFKGTQIKPDDDYSTSKVVNEHNIHLNGEFIGMSHSEHDTDTFYDSLLVRQKIDCSLTELHERYLKMEEALKDVCNADNVFKLAEARAKCAEALNHKTPSATLGRDFFENLDPNK